jgi:signal transduction histidine kinase
MNTPVLGKLSENKEFLYAIFLILAIPTALVINTFILIQRVNNDFETEITSKANLATNVLTSSIKEIATNSSQLYSHIQKISSDSADVKGLTVLSFQQGNPVILATTEGEDSLSTNNILQSKLAWTTGQPYTTKLETLTDDGKASRLWQVSMPLRENDENIAVVNLKISGEKSDNLIAKIQQDALLFSIGTIVVLVLLLLNHFRFFGYARTFVKLKEVDEMKDNFISMASHELRTPVTALRGFAQLAASNFRKGNSSNLAHDLEVIDKSADGIANLVNDMLDVSRIEQKRMTVDMKPVDLTAVTTEVLTQLNVQALEKKLTLNYQKTTPLIVNADERKLKQVLVNIVGNAIKYTPSGSVSVSHETVGESVKTLVSDTGMGIPAEELPKLFEKFHRVQNEQTKSIRGTGLGLWITKQIIEIMNGKLMVESIQNKGTTMIITFPLSKKS